MSNCQSCGDLLRPRDVAYESKVAVEGTAGSRVRRVLRWCADCHAHNEYRRHQAIQQARSDQWADLTPEERVGYLARKGAREGIHVSTAPI